MITDHHRSGPRRAARLALLFAVGAAACSTAAADRSPAAAPPPERPVDRLLELVDIESIVAARANRFAVQVGVLAGDLSDPELERLVPIIYREFAAESLRADITTRLVAGAPDGAIDEVVGWLESGANAEAQEIIAAYEPPVPLREWLGAYVSEPPSIERIQAVAGWVEARGSATLFLLLEEALDEAAHTVVATLRPGAAEFEPLLGDELRIRLDQGSAAAVMRALHESETVPSPLIAAATDEYDSAAGRWFVQAYQLAVAESMRAAAGRVVGSLSG